MEISDEIVEMAHKAVTTEMCEGDDMRALLRAVLTAAAPALTASDFTEPGPVVAESAAVDPRDTALRLAREALEPFAAEAGNFDRQRGDNILVEIPVHLRKLRACAFARAAIDAIGAKP